MVVKGITFTEVVEVLDVIDCYDRDVLVEGEDGEGVVYQAVGVESCGEIVDIDEDTIDFIF